MASDRNNKQARRQRRKQRDRISRPATHDGAVLERLLAKVRPDMHEHYRMVYVDASRIRAAAESGKALFDDLNGYIDRTCGEWEQRSQPACKAGCDWCCHQDVLLAPFERDVVIGEMRRLNLQEKVEARLAEEQHFVWVPAAGKKMPISPCPFLEDHRCLIYDRRPIACRTQYSLDAEPCERAVRSALASGGDVSYQRAVVPAATGVAARNAVDRKRRVSMREELRRALKEPASSREP